jgi:hypothetical protein
MLRLVCYVAIASVYVYSLHFDVTQMPLIRGDTWWYKLRFLTMLNMVVYTGYILLSTVRAAVDVISERRYSTEHSGSGSSTRSGGNKRGGLSRTHSNTPAHHAPLYYSQSTLHSICDFLYAVVIIPMGLGVVALFWGIYAVDRELVHPKRLDAIVPSWLNHVMHTAPVPFILVDTLLMCHRYPSRGKGMLTVVTVALLYVCVLLLTKHFDDVWMYPVLEVLNVWQRGLLFSGATAFMVLLYLLGDGLNSIVWGKAAHSDMELDASGNVVSSAAKSARIKAAGTGRVKQRRD